MELHQLEQFVAVVDQGSFSAAAEHLRVVQSAVSKTIRELERALGVRLLERSPGSRHLALTSSGEILLPEAREILDRARVTREVVAASGRAPVGRMSIGTMTILGPIRLPDLLVAYRAEAPAVDVQLHVRPRGSADLLNGVVTGEFDLAFLATGGPIPEGIRTITVAKLPLRLLVPIGHRLADSADVTLADVADERWIDSPRGYGNRQVTDAAFSGLGLSRSIGIEVYEIQLLPDLVAAGLGVGLYPGTPPTLEGLVSLPLRDPGLPHLHIQVAVREGARRPAVEAFLRALTTVQARMTALDRRA